MKNKDSKYKIILLFILVLALTLRLINIDWGISKDRLQHSYYPDEPYGYAAAFNIRPFSGELDPGNWALIKGTFYYEIVGTVNQTLELTKIKDIVLPNPEKSEAVAIYNNYLLARFISVLFSLATIFLIYLFAVLIFNNKVIGLISAFSYSIFTQEIIESNILAGDIALTFFTLCVIYFSIKYLKEKKTKQLLLASAFVGFSVATKYTGFLTALPVLLTFFYVDLSKFKIIKETVIKAFKSLAAFLMALIIGIPALLFKFNDFLDGLKVQEKYQTGEFLDGQGQLPAFIFYFSNILLYGLGIVFVTLILIGTFYYLKKNYKTKETKIILIWLIPYYIMISLASWITTRYSMPLLPIFVTFMAFSIYTIYKNIKFKKVFIGILTILYVYNALFLFNTVEAINQPTVHDKFDEYAKANLSLSTETPDITFIAHYPDMSSFPVYISYAANLALIRDIEANPKIEIPTKYILLSNNNFRNYRRTGNQSMIEFLDRLEKSDEYKLLKIFEADYKIPYINNENAFYSNDLLIFFQKFYLYEKQ